MSLQIDDPEAEALAVELSKRTGLPINRAVVGALQAQRSRAVSHKPGSFERATAIANHCASLPDLDRRSVDEILGYNRHGVWD